MDHRIARYAIPNTALSQIHMQIMWSRLIAVVEEQAQTLVLTAFSTTVREAGDLSAGVFDNRGDEVPKDRMREREIRFSRLIPKGPSTTRM